MAQWICSGLSQSHYFNMQQPKLLFISHIEIENCTRIVMIIGLKKWGHSSPKTQSEQTQPTVGQSCLHLPLLWPPCFILGARGAYSYWQGEDYGLTDVIGSVRSRSNVEWLYILTQLFLKSRVIHYLQDVWLVLVTLCLPLNTCCFLYHGLSYLPINPIELKPLKTKIRGTLP